MAHLTDIMLMRNMLQKNVEVNTGRIDEDGEPIMTRRFDYPCFAIVRHPIGKKMDIESIVQKAYDKELKKSGNEATAQVKADEKRAELATIYEGLAMTFRISSGSAVAYQDGFELVPIYAGITEIRPLKWWRDNGKKKKTVTVDGDETAESVSKSATTYDHLGFGEVLFTCPGDTFTASTVKEWSDNPVERFNAAAEAAGSPYMVEQIVKFKSIDPLMAQLETNINYLDAIRKIRIGMGNTITNNAYFILGPERYDEVKASFDENKTSFIKEVYKEYKHILKDRKVSKTTGELTRISQANFNPTKLIPSWAFFESLQTYSEMMEAEEHLDKSIASLVKQHPFWTQYLEGIKGCGTKHAGYIIAGLDPTVCRHPSGWIRYLGLDTVWDESLQRNVGRNMTHKRLMPLVNKDGDVTMVETLGYNTHLKSRIYLLAENMIKCGDPYYKSIYNNAKAYYQNRPDLKKRWEAKAAKEEWVKGDKSNPHLMALRKMMCTFVVDLWLVERRILGLPLNGGRYEEEKLGIYHGYGHPFLDDSQAETPLS